MKDTVLFQASHIPTASQVPTLSPDFQKFNSLLRDSNKILFKMSSVFPFDFFPDEITIDEYKVNIIFHEFFLSEDVHSITIDMIKDIEVEAGPLFAILKIVPDGYPGKVVEVKNLKRSDAIRARKIILGLMVMKKQGIDPIKLYGHNFTDKIELLGTTHLVE